MVVVCRAATASLEDDVRIHAGVPVWMIVVLGVGVKDVLLEDLGGSWYGEGSLYSFGRTMGGIDLRLLG